jgi:hypothetical protein
MKLPAFKLTPVQKRNALIAAGVFVAFVVLAAVFGPGVDSFVTNALNG